jgi:hypothetical protein
LVCPFFYNKAHNKNTNPANKISRIGVLSLL